MQVQQQFEQSAALKYEMAKTLPQSVLQATEAILSCLKGGGKVLVCGNGGSAADAQHFAAEFINRFNIDRKPLPAIALTTDSSALTSIGNDSGFEEIFKKQVQALGKEEDILIVMTTSDVSFQKHGHSANIGQAILAAKTAGMRIIGLASLNGKEILKHLDIPIVIPHTDTPRIQEGHITVLHVICDLVEQGLFT